MGTKTFRCLFISANVGSIFEEPEKLMRKWLESVWKLVQTKKPHFLAVHFQEVGGKKSEVCRDLVHDFLREFLAHETLIKFTRSIAYLDEDYGRSDRYTALGCLYCVHDELEHASMWDFKEEKFIPVPEERTLQTGTLKNVITIDKWKFPLRCFPKEVWSRKGFMWTRWKLCNRTWDLVNIHLLHDASNVEALEASPSMYARYRQEALVYVFERLRDKKSVRHVLFGDFNTRLDTKLFIEHYLSDAPSIEIKKDGNKRPDSIIFRDLENENIGYDRGRLSNCPPSIIQRNACFTVKVRRNAVKLNKMIDRDVASSAFIVKDLLQVASRQFQLYSWKIFHMDRISELRKFDNEFKWCESKLKEFEIEFLPSYPHTEDPLTGDTFSGTRCPSWCDRVMMCPTLFDEIKQTKTAEYNCIGQGICVGDHKPVYLTFEALCPLDEDATLHPEEDTSETPS